MYRLFNDVLVPHIERVPCHHGMARPQVADGEADRRESTNKQSRAPDEGWS
jgi:hypothetical protein